jgi:hypothetical protein
MNTHTYPTERIALPRRLVPRRPATLRFDEGQCVNHKSGGMPSIVTKSELTTAGREHYRLWGITPEERRERWILGDYLVATLVGGADCEDCPLRRFCCDQQ